MINTVFKNDVKNKLSPVDIINDVYLLPKWEKISSFSLNEKKFIFSDKTINLSLYRKFSSKNLVEKYSVKSQNGENIACMDLKVYKDSVYIINLNVNISVSFNKLTEYLLQIAIEKALYNTSEKKVVINLSSGIFIKNLTKKILTSNEFLQEENQSSLEKKIFGETFSINLGTDSLWMKKIKAMPILINK